MAKRKKPCEHCDRVIGDRLRKKCRRCPQVGVIHRLYENPIAAVTAVVVDPGSRSTGVSVWHVGKHWFSQSIDPWGEDPDRIMKEAAELSRQRGTDIVLIGEDWGAGGPFGGLRTMMGLVQAWGIMKRAALLQGVKKSRIWRIPVQTWRAAHRARSGVSQDWKAWALARANELTGSSWAMLTQVSDDPVTVKEVPWTDEDAADAYLMGWAALRLPETADRVTARAFRKEPLDDTYINHWPPKAPRAERPSTVGK